MTWQLNLNVYIMLVAGAISLAVAVFSFYRHRVPGSAGLVAVNLAGMIWAWTTAFEIMAGTLSSAVFFHKLSFLGMDVIGVAWFAFAAEYAGRESWATVRRLAVLCLLPLATQVLVWTNQFHHLVFQPFALDRVGDHLLLSKTPAAWWWVDSVYTYVLLFGGIVMLGVMFVRGFGLYRRQISALLLAVIVPMVADFLYTYGVSQSENVNLAPALFAWVGIALYWGFSHYRLLDVTPVAREFVAQHMGDALIVTDTEDRATYINLAAEELLGRELRIVVGRPVAEVMAGVSGLIGVYDKAQELPEDSSQEWKHGDYYYDGRVSELRDGRGRKRGSIVVLRDTTDRKRAEMALDEIRRGLEDRVMERTAELATEKEHLAQLNTIAVEIAYCVTSADVLATGVRLACAVVEADAGTLWVRSAVGKMRLLGNEGVSQESWQALQNLLNGSAEVTEAMGDGSAVCVNVESANQSAGVSSHHHFERVLVVPLVARGIKLGALCLVSCDSRFGTDQETVLLAGAIASQIAVALDNARRYEDAQYLAERDSLTRLLNHRGFSKRLEQEVAQSERQGSVFALVMIDVDNFKFFNDAYGHVVGDQVLQEVSRILANTLRRSDIVARHGGDEFSAILPDTSAEAAVRVLERVRDCLEDSPFVTGDNRSVPLKMSYGVATFPYDGRTSAELLAAADANLYRSKRRGGDFITASGSSEDQCPIALGSFSVLDGLVTTVDKKDHYTRRHSEDVTEYAVALAAKLDLSPETQRSLRVAGLLHDVGKVGVPDHILRKPAQLTEAEFEVIKNHVTVGELIIQGIPDQEEVLSAVSSHHERWDGAGYPRGLAGEHIPLLGRILGVTDAYSAMTTDRPYRRARSAEEAMAELKRVAGSQLDPRLVDLFLEVLEEDAVTEKSRVAVFASDHF